MKHYALLALLIIGTSAPAMAQDVNERLDQIEQDMVILKRQQDRGGRGASGAPSADGGVGNAQIDVRITALEEELRGLRGKLEESEFERKRISEELERFRRDTELRLSDIEKANHAAPAAVEPKPEAPAKPAAEKETAPKKAEVSVKEVPTEAAEKPAAEAKAEEGATSAEDTPRDRYNYAFRLLNQNQYDEAAKHFADFTKKYPKNPLVGNAYYWQGETHYIRKDYAAAADLFRQGYEAMPSGPKAADNLLKMGMSLAALKKKDEACVVLGQVVSKYKTSSANVAAKAQAEQKRAACGG